MSDAPSPSEGPADSTVWSLRALGAVAAFFDLDKTIIAKAAISAFRGPLYTTGLLSRRSLARALVAQLLYLHLGARDRRLARMSEVLLRLTAGWDANQVRTIVDEALERIVEPLIFAEALELIELHRAEGDLIVIVSASPEEIVVPLARHLGIENVISSKAAVDKSGRYTGALAFYAFGDAKADALAEFAKSHDVDLDRSYAYSDSINDLPMLEAVGHPVAVNPDRSLAKIARDRSWDIHHFVHPVPLRARVRVYPQRTIWRVVGSLAASALGAIGLTLWIAARKKNMPEAKKARTTD